MQTPEYDRDDRDRAWRYYQHADNLHATRINFFMVAESMLVLSFATTVAQQMIYLRYAITGLGLVYTLSWFLANHSIVQRMVQVLLPLLQLLDPIYGRYSAFPIRVESRYYLTYIVPLVTLAFWMVLLYFQLSADISPLIFPKIKMPPYNPYTTAV